MNYQVIFLDSEGIVQAGIWNSDTDEIICGCCGGIIESGNFVLLHIYNSWVNISNEICGDDGEILNKIKEKLNRPTVEEILHRMKKKTTYPTMDEVRAILNEKEDFNE